MVCHLGSNGRRTISQGEAFERAGFFEEWLLIIHECASFAQGSGPVFLVSAMIHNEVQILMS